MTGDDVYRRYLCHIVHRQVVVVDHSTLCIHKVATETHSLGSSPHLVNNTAGILHGETFLIETGPLSAHHVEQDAITCLITLLVQVGCPMLCTQRP